MPRDIHIKLCEKSTLCGVRYDREQDLNENPYTLCFGLFVEKLLSYGREVSWVVV